AFKLRNLRKFWASRVVSTSARARGLPQDGITVEQYHRPGPRARRNLRRRLPGDWRKVSKIPDDERKACHQTSNGTLTTEFLDPVIAQGAEFLMATPRGKNPCGHDAR